MGQIIFLTLFLYGKWFFDKTTKNKLSKKSEGNLKIQNHSHETGENDIKSKNSKRVNFKHDTIIKAE